MVCGLVGGARDGRRDWKGWHRERLRLTDREEVDSYPNDNIHVERTRNQEIPIAFFFLITYTVYTIHMNSPLSYSLLHTPPHMQCSTEQSTRFQSNTYLKLPRRGRVTRFRRGAPALLSAQLLWSLDSLYMHAQSFSAIIVPRPELRAISPVLLCLSRLFQLATVIPGPSHKSRWPLDREPSPMCTSPIFDNSLALWIVFAVFTGAPRLLIGLFPRV